jgi:hypothetical protein
VRRVASRVPPRDEDPPKLRTKQQHHPLPATSDQGTQGEDEEVSVVVVVSAPKADALVVPTIRSTNWRYVTGAFAVRIPVSVPVDMLPAERDLQAVLAWKLNALPVGSRWFKVLQWYLGHVTARVDGIGGKDLPVVPSPAGAVPVPVGGGAGCAEGGWGCGCEECGCEPQERGRRCPHHCSRRHCCRQDKHYGHGQDKYPDRYPGPFCKFVGRVAAVKYGPGGELVGFVHCDEQGCERSFDGPLSQGLEFVIGEAWRRQDIVEVETPEQDKSYCVSVTVRGYAKRRTRSKGRCAIL